MPEKVNDKTIFSLSEVAQSIQRTLADRYHNSFWVKAEMNKLNRYPHSGHCYPDLVEKLNGKIVAELRANIWKDDFDTINTRFLEVLHEPLKDGVNILFSAKITFHAIYGLSLRIIDIDPSFSLGELEREKKETIKLLRKEGVFNLNKTQRLALLPKRIAIISVQTSKGYADFMKVIGENPWGYKFFTMLFPALLQGENAVESILRQLTIIGKVQHHFDAVAIIRGGGGDIGLTCYNNLSLVRTIALFPIPVITGIGHSTNETVSEMVAHKNAITPTELADFLIQHFHNFSVPVNTAKETIAALAVELIKEEKRRTKELGRLFKNITLARLNERKHWLDQLTSTLLGLANHFLKMSAERQINQNLRSLARGAAQVLLLNMNRLTIPQTKLNDQTRAFTSRAMQKISQCEKMIEIMDPIHVLKRGFSITMAKNHVVHSAGELEQGEIIQTILSDGSVTSIINNIKKKQENE